eukprot:scaffold31800_cov112-Isochrysis_galbana.AAC.3
MYMPLSFAPASVCFESRESCFDLGRRRLVECATHVGRRRRLRLQYPLRLRRAYEDSSRAAFDMVGAILQPPLNDRPSHGGALGVGLRVATDQRTETGGGDRPSLSLGLKGVGILTGDASPTDEFSCPPHARSSSRLALSTRSTARSQSGLVCSLGCQLLSRPCTGTSALARRRTARRDWRGERGGGFSGRASKSSGYGLAVKFSGCELAKSRESPYQASADAASAAE